ncbi:MAG TPA: phosphatidylglycerophosphatase A [Vicinamibacterales bacterium]|jgi:phosphatidylglycerophosphatase A|nr:phosphatidylglycerophosphatase A [Vicinamibacterales bacterium]
MRRLGLFIATCGYIGFAPVAPGTVGSAAGVALFYLIRGVEAVWAQPLLIAVLFAAGVWAASIAEQALGGTDPGPVVIDEVIGMLITLLWLPVTPLGALVGFLVFRVLDVVKPWPSRQFESLHGGLGIMADDAMAAVYGHLLMRGFLWLVPAGWLA